jgi:hypothetical protein
MRSMHRVLRVVTVMVLVGVGFLARAEASPVVSIDPASQTANVGDTVSADILVSGLTDPLGGFSLLLSFDDAILTGTSFTNDPDAKMGPSPLDLSGGFNGAGGSPLDLFFVADASLDAAALSALQGTGFRLGTIQFLAVANGVSPLSIGSLVLSNASGSATIPANAVNGKVCVGGPCPVPAPEPSVFLMLGAAGLFALFMRRYRPAQFRA